MPQLDFFVFFGLSVSFLLMVVGMVFFSAYLVPLLISLAKLGGTRTYFFLSVYLPCYIGVSYMLHARLFTLCKHPEY
jgi:hypothetical protein